MAKVVLLQLLDAMITYLLGPAQKIHRLSPGRDLWQHRCRGCKVPLRISMNLHQRIMEGHKIVCRACSLEVEDGMMGPELG